MGDQETRVQLKTKSYFINDELNEEERCFSSCHELGTKKKFWVPMRNWTSDLRILHCDALPLSQNRSQSNLKTFRIWKSKVWLLWYNHGYLMVIWSVLWCSTTELELECGTVGLRFNSSWGLRIFSLSNACDKTKNIFLYFFTELKTYHLSYSFYKLNDTCLLIGSFLWSIGNKCIDDLTIEKFFFLYHITQIDSMLPWICSAVNHRRQ